MNHIHKLQKQVAEQAREIEALRLGIHDLKAYLQSDKFHTDTTVQVADVLRRLAEVLTEAGEAAGSTEFVPAPVSQKASIRTNRFGNLYGYVGNRKAADFGLSQVNADEWLRHMKGQPLKYPGCFDFMIHVYEEFKKI